MKIPIINKIDIFLIISRSENKMAVEQLNVLSMSEKNEMAKNIFLQSVEKCDKGKLEEYRVKYCQDGEYFNLDLSRLLIKATSRGSAVFILMRYFDENLVTPRSKEKGAFHYYDKLEFLFEYSYVFDENDNNCISYNFMKKLEKDGLRDGLFDNFVDNEFDNDTLWLEVGEPEPMILTM